MSQSNIEAGQYERSIDRMLNINDVIDQTSLSRRLIYRHIHQGTFRKAA